MKKRLLGKSGLEVSELGLGGLFLKSDVSTYEHAREAVLRALALGINYIDTAPGYGDSQKVLGKALKGTHATVILSTKLGYQPEPFRPQDKEFLKRSVETSLRLLGRDSVDILMIHEPDRPGQFNWWTDQENYYGPVIELLDELKRGGTIRYSGLAGSTAYEMAHVIRSGEFDVLLTAMNYSALWREAEHAILPAAKEKNMGIIIGSALQQGALASRYDEEVRGAPRWLAPPRRAQFTAFYEFLNEIDMSPYELSLRFVISNLDVSCVLMGARSREEVEHNVEAVENGPLPKHVLKRLNEIAAMVPFRPCDEGMTVPFGFGIKYGGPGAGR